MTNYILQKGGKSSFLIGETNLKAKL